MSGSPVSIDAGELTEPVAIERLETVYEDGGEPVDRWVGLHALRWARVEQLSDVDLIRAQKIANRVTMVITMHYEPEIDALWSGDPNAPATLRVVSLRNPARVWYVANVENKGMADTRMVLLCRVTVE